MKLTAENITEHQKYKEHHIKILQWMCYPFYEEFRFSKRPQFVAVIVWIHFEFA